MAWEITKDLLRRIEIIANVLDSTTGYTVEELAKISRVSKQTILRDLSIIRSFPLDIYSRKRIVKISRINDKVLNELIFAYTALYSGDYIRLLKPLKRKFKESLLISFVNIIQAINKKEILIICYGKDDKGFDIFKSFVPFALHQTERTFSIYGFQDENGKEVKSYLLEKISKIRKTGRKSEIKDFPDFSSVIQYAWGSYTGGEKQKIKILFKGDFMKHFKDRIYAEEQDVTETPDGTILEINVKISTQLISWIMGWAGKAIVLEPKSLRDTIKRNSQKLLKAYNN